MAFNSLLSSWDNFPSKKGKEEDNEEKKQEKETKETIKDRSDFRKVDDGDSGGDGDKIPPGKGFPNELRPLITWGIALLGYWLLKKVMRESTVSTFEISWSEFVSRFLAVPGSIVKLVAKEGRDGHPVIHIHTNENGGEIYFYPIASTDTFESDLEEAQKELDIPEQSRIGLSYADPPPFFNRMVSTVLPTLAVFLIFFAVLSIIQGRIPFLPPDFLQSLFDKSKGKGIDGKGKSKSKGKKDGDIFGDLFGTMKYLKSNARLITVEEKVSSNFSDVAGLPEAKAEIIEFVDFLKNPSRYEVLGARIPKGAMLTGPPGTGKTLLAKAAAGEAGVPFIATSGSDFLEMYVGVGPSRVRDLFATAREHRPCIVFIDEIDAVARQRGGSGWRGGGNDERENTLNQLLVELDGFGDRENIIVLAGTNRADILDKALLRPGRFDRQIHLSNPDLLSRQEIFDLHLKPLSLTFTSKTLSPEDEATERGKLANKLAAQTPGFSGADIANACNEAALIAARREGESIGYKDFSDALDRIIGGLEKKSTVLTPAEKNSVSVHEAGHAVVGWFLKHTDPVLKVNIIPRSSGALGFTQLEPKEEYILTKSQLEDKMCAMLGGRVAEMLSFGGMNISTGAQDDLKKVTDMAYNLCSTYGMNAKLGLVSFPRDKYSLRPYSESTAEVLDEEVRQLTNLAFERTTNLLMERRKELDAIASLLHEKESIDQGDMIEICGERIWVDAQDLSKPPFDTQTEFGDMPTPSPV